MAENGYKRKLLISSISAQWYSNCSKKLEISCTGLAIFAISLLLLMIFLSIRVIHLESCDIRCIRKFAVDPAISCKRNRSSLMNFPIIWGFLKRKLQSTCESLRLFQLGPYEFHWLDSWFKYFFFKLCLLNLLYCAYLSAFAVT